MTTIMKLTELAADRDTLFKEKGIILRDVVRALEAGAAQNDFVPAIPQIYSNLRSTVSLDFCRINRRQRIQIDHTQGFMLGIAKRIAAGKQRGTNSGT